MTNHDLIAHLRASGHRLTPQRQFTLEVLQQNDHHISADQIAEQIATRYPQLHIDTATIYRTLRWLRDIGLVSEMSLGQNCMVYALTSHHQHHHLICQRCHIMIDVDAALFDNVRDELQRRYQFAARLDHLAIFGLCEQCQQRR
jgi:Fur family ferric uptake transcriptional regulator